MYWLQKREILWPLQLGGGPVTHPTRLTPEGQPVRFLQTSQKAVDVGLAYHLIRSHSKRRWERLYLAAGDADFHEPVQALVEQDNVDLILLGTEPSIASVLKPYAKRIVDLANEPTRSAVARSK
jgi:uncharacterized LabA/DUF88 family protein